MDLLMSYIKHAYDQFDLIISRYWYVVLVLFAVGLIADGISSFRRAHKPRPGCVFCKAANGTPDTEIVRRWRWRGVVALVPLNPVVEGHVLLVSRWHTCDAGENPRLTAKLMRCAAELMNETLSANLITSKGTAATQTVFHTHVHIVPRRVGDELALPWTGQVEKA